MKTQLKTILLLLFVSVMMQSSTVLPKEDYHSHRLLSFYKKYYDVMSNPTSKDTNMRLYNLLKTYCTSEFANCQMNETTNGAGVDFIAMDFIDSLNPETIEVSKIEENIYRVSFIAKRQNIDGSNSLEKISLLVTLQGLYISDVNKE